MVHLVWETLCVQVDFPLEIVNSVCCREVTTDQRIDDGQNNAFYVSQLTLCRHSAAWAWASASA